MAINKRTHGFTLKITTALLVSISYGVLAADTTPPIVTTVKKIPAYTNDSTPDFMFNSTEAGTITYSSACPSTKTAAIKGNNVITFSNLASGAHDCRFSKPKACCSITVTDAAGNSDKLNVPTFRIDKVAPVLTQVRAVTSPTAADFPSYIFDSSEVGTIFYNGDCKSVQKEAIQFENVIRFNTLAIGTHSNCTIKVTDRANNTSIPLAVNSFSIVAKPSKPLNDTGITLCLDYGFTPPVSGLYQNNLDCSLTGSSIDMAGIDADGDPVPAGQDAHYGRDADVMANTDTDGYKGFSYTKLDSNGAEMAANATGWKCVKDNVTGLIWEHKTSTNKDYTYVWYNTTSTTNGGQAGGVGTATCGGPTQCNTKAYVTQVNAAALCGSTAWRLPTINELKSLRSFKGSSPAIDVAYFPNTVTYPPYTTSTTVGANLYSELHISFLNGAEGYGNKTDAWAVRLVHK